MKARIIFLLFVYSSILLCLVMSYNLMFVDTSAPSKALEQNMVNLRHLNALSILLMVFLGISISFVMKKKED